MTAHDEHDVGGQPTRWESGERTVELLRCVISIERAAAVLLEQTIPHGPDHARALGLLALDCRSRAERAQARLRDLEQGGSS